MSATTTATVTFNSLDLLADYEIHQTPSAEPDVAPPPNEHPEPQRSRPLENQSSWPTDYHRIPPYRPVNRELDQSQRAVYQNRVEQAFVNVMLSGVWFNATVAQLWRATGGRLNSKIFQYQIGGEW